MLMKMLRIIHETLKETMGCLELLRAELRNSGGLEVFVEQLARMFPPLIVRCETERPTKTHTINVSIRRRFALKKEIHVQFNHHWEPRPDPKQPRKTSSIQSKA